MKPILAILLFIVSTLAGAQAPSPHAIEIPRWFSNSLLDFKDEIPEAARAGKRVMVYFGQDGCPYCTRLMRDNFGPGAVADKTRKHFTAIAINIFGDADVTWTDGTQTTEKGLARLLKIQFTPTLLFFEKDGSLILRVNGYQPPERFTHILDYVIGRQDRQMSLASYLESKAKPAAGKATPKAAAYLMDKPGQLARAGRSKPLAVLFETAACKSCAEMHAEAFARAPMKTLLAQFDVARLLPGEPAALTTPDGRRMEADRWARELNIAIQPTVVFFDKAGAEVFRFDGYLRPFHIESAFEYVASQAYAREPQFQRFVQARAERLREDGKAVDLWR